MAPSNDRDTKPDSAADEPTSTPQSASTYHPLNDWAGPRRVTGEQRRRVAELQRGRRR